MLAMILYNIWQFVNYCFLAPPLLRLTYADSKSKAKISVTIPAMKRFFVNYLAQRHKHIAKPLVTA